MHLTVVILVVLAATVSAFTPRFNRLSTFRKTEISQQSRLYSFTPGPGDKDRKITREKDAEADFFESEFDRQPIKDRLPIAFGFLGAVSLPFIIGLVYLYTNR